MKLLHQRALLKGVTEVRALSFIQAVLEGFVILFPPLIPASALLIVGCLSRHFKSVTAWLHVVDRFSVAVPCVQASSFP